MAAQQICFLITIRQNKNVTTYGPLYYWRTNRADARFVESPHTNLQMRYPIALRVPEIYKKPIDNIGIPPDVPIPPGADWVEFVLKYKK